jgi:putative SOS response-associated peptidase YedK
MCGRYELNETPARLGSRYRIDPGALEFAANADVRPTETNPVILLNNGRRIVSMRKWGIVLFWAKDPKAISTPFTARSEDAYSKPMFRGPFKSKRCIVPATAFFEWQFVPGQKKTQKIRITRADGDLITLAALYDYWHHGDEAIESYTRPRRRTPSWNGYTIACPSSWVRATRTKGWIQKPGSTLRGRCAWLARVSG